VIGGRSFFLGVHPCSVLKTFKVTGGKSHLLEVKSVIYQTCSSK
jgi:hypothetical protein